MQISAINFEFVCKVVYQIPYSLIDKQGID